jgi:serine protease Do
MTSAVNPATSAGISIGSAIGSIADWLRQFTVRVSSGNSHGSGVIWSPDGLIVTNAHVASSQVHDVEFANGTKTQGWVLAREREVDLAAIAVNVGGLAAAAVRSSATIRAGELVIAVGNPWDGEGAVSAGVVHRRSNDRWLVADIRLAPGNSGGPLTDAEGSVVGINSMIVNGFGVAVASDAVEAFLRNTRLAEAV